MTSRGCPVSKFIIACFAEALSLSVISKYIISFSGGRDGGEGRGGKAKGSGMEKEYPGAAFQIQ